MLGTPALRGGAASTIAVAALTALALPSRFVAVTRSRISAPTSAETSV